MSTTPTNTPATPATTGAPAAGAETPPPKITSVPKDIRQRILSGGRPPGPVDPEKEKADKAAADKAAADKAAADKAEGDKKAAEEKAAADKKKNKAPKLPDPPKPAGDEPKSLKDQVREILPEITRENAPPAKPKLAPEVEAEVALAEFAEKQHGDKYAGMGKKVLDFYIQHDELIASKMKELGGRNSPDFKEWQESEEYRGFIDQNRPRYERGDKEKLKEAAISARAKEDAKREMEPKLRELELKQLEAEVRPQIKQAIDQAVTIIITDPRPEAEQDPALVAFVKDPMKFGEEHPEEAQAIASEAQQYAKYVETVMRVDKHLEEPDLKKPEHAYIHKFMVRHNDLFAEKYPNGIRASDGKILVDAITFRDHGLKDNPDYRTWNATEIAGMLAAEGNARVLDRLRARKEGVAKSIYAKVPALAAPANNGQAAPANNEPADEPGSVEAETTRGGGKKKESKESKSTARKYG